MTAEAPARIAAMAVGAPKSTGDTGDRMPLATTELARLGAEEMARYRSGAPVAGAYGFELFRRAVVDRDELAWVNLYAQYGPLVRYWVGPETEDGVAEDVVAAAFERFWQALDAATFDQFAALSAVLRYLKLCARSARLDRRRAARARAREKPLDETVHALPAPDNLEEQLARAGEADAFWRMVGASLATERERAVVYLCYVCGLTPREICARYGAQFPEVAVVYRIKRVALDRLRRRPALLTLHSPMGRHLPRSPRVVATQHAAPRRQTAQDRLAPPWQPVPTPDCDHHTTAPLCRDGRGRP
jgi:RNA polymerase sigma factor (sigma-70 family)